MRATALPITLPRVPRFTSVHHHRAMSNAIRGDARCVSGGYGRRRGTISSLMARVLKEGRYLFGGGRNGPSRSRICAVVGRGRSGLGRDRTCAGDKGYVDRRLDVYFHRRGVYACKGGRRCRCSAWRHHQGVIIRGGWFITTMMRRGVGDDIYDRGVIIHRWWFIIMRRGVIFINV